MLKRETNFNKVFAQYGNLYYGDATTSCYVAETGEENSFNAAFLIKKELAKEKHIEDTTWDACHVVNVTVKDNKCTFITTSTVFITFNANMTDLGKMSLAGSGAKTIKKTVSLPADYAKNPDGFYCAYIGQFIETNEGELRTQVVDHYVTKQRQIINTSRINEEYLHKANTQLMEMKK